MSEWAICVLAVWGSGLVAALVVYRDMRHPTMAEERLTSIEGRIEDTEKRIGEIEMSQGLRVGRMGRK